MSDEPRYSGRTRAEWVPEQHGGFSDLGMVAHDVIREVDEED